MRRMSNSITPNSRLPEDGNIYKSIEINKDCFKLSEQTVDIFINTAKRLGW